MQIEKQLKRRSIVEMSTDLGEKLNRMKKTKSVSIGKRHDHENEDDFFENNDHEYYGNNCDNTTANKTNKEDGFGTVGAVTLCAKRRLSSTEIKAITVEKLTTVEKASKCSSSKASNDSSLKTEISEQFRSKSPTERSPSRSPFSKMTRRGSQHLYAEPNQTVIVFDWDDTVFPTTWVRDDVKLNWRFPLEHNNLSDESLKMVKQYLSDLEDEVIALLRKAFTVSNCVIIVTLAKFPWVSKSCRFFMPRLERVIFEELKIPIVYARDMKYPAPESNVTSSKTSKETQSILPNSQSEAKLTEYALVKGRAIAVEVDKFYSQYPGQTWKNIISVGDSEFERLGTQSIILKYFELHNQDDNYWIRNPPSHVGSPISPGSAGHGASNLLLNTDNSVDSSATSSGSPSPIQGDSWNRVPTFSDYSHGSGSVDVETVPAIVPANDVTSTGQTQEPSSSSSSTIPELFTAGTGECGSSTKSNAPKDIEGSSADDSVQNSAGKTAQNIPATTLSADHDRTQALFVSEGSSTPRTADDGASAQFVASGYPDDKTALLEQLHGEIQVQPSERRSASRQNFVGKMDEDLTSKELHVRCKTVKMLDEPTVEELTAEVTLLNLWISQLVYLDQGVDFRLDDSTDDSQIHTIHGKLLGKDADVANLTWGKLGGWAEESTADMKADILE